MADGDFSDAFDAALPEMGGAGTLVIDIDGFEGPLDLLLSLAREQKVDLEKISVLQLAEQYLEFIAGIQGRRLELAADYLVMAAWLAYLKSRLLLPQPQPGEEPSGEEMAAALAFQLQRLEAMRDAGGRLMARPRLFRDVWPRGMPEEIQSDDPPVWDLGLYDLLKAYGSIAARRSVTALDVEASDLYSVDLVIGRLEAMLGKIPDWSTLASFLPPGLAGLVLRSAVAAHFVASLELCRQGKIEIRQEGVFSPLWLRPVNREGK